MLSKVQLAVAIRQQPRVAAALTTMQPMVANGSSERERARFKQALTARVEREHPEKRGQPQWLHAKLAEYRQKPAGRHFRSVSPQTCAYWLSGKKIARHENATLLCEALGMTRGELFGESQDQRLSLIVERWDDLPENLKNGLYNLAKPDEASPAPAPAPTPVAPTRVRKVS